jgi:hypothetical protein
MAAVAVAAPAVVTAPPPSLPLPPHQPVVDQSTSQAIDELIASATQGIAVQQDAPPPLPAADKERKGAVAAKKADKNARMVYSDNDVSPEEKMAALARYAYSGVARG